MRGVWVAVVVWYTVRGVPMIMVGFAGPASQGTSRNNIDPAKPHVDPDIELPSQRFTALSQRHGITLIPPSFMLTC
jgi:hypothetical protein